jgi:hypothetical protein
MTSRIYSPTGSYVEADDTIEYRPFAGPSRTVQVQAVYDNVKNGRPGFDAVVTSGPEKGEQVWGYADQISAVTHYRPGPAPASVDYGGAFDGFQVTSDADPGL